MNTFADRFSGVKNARQTGGGSWFQEGGYTVEVRRLAYEATRNPQVSKGTENLIGEFEVIESTNPNIIPGVTRSQVIQRDMNAGPDNVRNRMAEGSMQNLFNAVLQAMGVTQARIDAMTPAEYGKACEELVGPSNPAGQKRVRLKLRATTIITRSGKPFTRHDWAPAA